MWLKDLEKSSKWAFSSFLNFIKQTVVFFTNTSIKKKLIGALLFGKIAIISKAANTLWPATLSETQQKKATSELSSKMNNINNG